MTRILAAVALAATLVLAPIGAANAQSTSKAPTYSAMKYCTYC